MSLLGSEQTPLLEQETEEVLTDSDLYREEGVALSSSHQYWLLREAHREGEREREIEIVRLGQI